MEIEKAKHISETVAEIEKIDKQIKEFGKTREFFQIIFRGENGNESQHSYTFNGSETENGLIRSYVNNILNKRKSNLIEILDKL